MYRNYRFLILVCLAVGLFIAFVGFLGGEVPMLQSEESAQMAYQKHVLACPECSKPLIDSNGDEHSICEVGFELLVRAMKAEKELK